MRTFKENRKLYTGYSHKHHTHAAPLGLKRGKEDQPLLYTYHPAAAKNTTPPKTLKIRAIRVIRDNPRFRQKYIDTAATGLQV